MKKIILDTNAYTYYATGREVVLDAISEADKVYMSIIVMGELYEGFKGGNLERENVRQLNSFLHKTIVHPLTLTRETSEIFGEVRNKLKKAGTPIPINDVWIGSQAIETGSILITFDKHFQFISGLRLWKPN